MDVDLGACLDGDQQAWEAFVARCSPVIYAAIRRALGSHGTGDDRGLADVMQDVFVRLIRHDGKLLRSFDPQRSALVTWLSLVARSVAIDSLRKRRIETVPLQPDEATAAGDLDGTPSSTGPAGESGTLADADLPWHLLTARQRLVLRLLYEDEQTVSQAAATLGVDEQTIRSTKHKALSRFREHFGDSNPGEEPAFGKLPGRSSEPCS